MNGRKGSQEETVTTLVRRLTGKGKNDFRVLHRGEYKMFFNIGEA